jgi:long-subunit acyl-CoA synthetase (AMP-forming)
MQLHVFMLCMSHTDTVVGLRTTAVCSLCCRSLFTVNGTTVPIYETLGEENVSFVLKQTGSKVVTAVIVVTVFTVLLAVSCSTCSL